MRVIAGLGKRTVEFVGRGWSALRHRPIALALSILMLVSSIAYPLGNILDARRYALSADVEQLVGDVNSNLASKLKLNDEKTVYEFNGGAEEPTTSLNAGPDPEAALASLRQQTGGGGKKSDNLYALDVPLNPKEGVTYYDKNLKLSFKTTPQFALSSGQTDDDGRIIFPGAKGTKAVYSLKTNGLKEDLVLTRPIGDSYSFSYKLDLPKELEARLHDDGSVGIYSADPMLFGDVSFGGDEDYEKLKSARETAVKDHLAFAIPAPVIVQQGNKSHSASSKFVLNGDVLTVESKGLEQLTYPISIDPSVVITSSSEFLSGNNEGGIDFATDEIKRGGLTGGITESWAATTSLTTAREMHRSEAYNGYAYAIGGYNGTTPLSSVEYAPINSNGTTGTWQTTSSFTNARSGHATAIYNGYLYLIGGYQGGGVVLNDVQYAKINSDGTLGTWQTTSSFTTARQQHTSVAYNGYLYLTGGASSSTVFYNDTQYAKVNADGTLGTWQSTSSFTTTRTNHASEVYNGYLYVMGGANSGSLSSVEYAKLNTDGTVGTWATTSALAASRNNHSSAVYNGYLYVMAGYASSGSNYATVEYASVNSNGTLGIWRTTGVNFTTARYNIGTFEYKGYLYINGGYNDTSRFADVQYAKIHPAGMNGAGAATTSLPTVRAQGKDYGRYGHTTVVYNNYIYVIGGYTNAGTSAVNYAPLNSDGSIGAWSTTTALPAARYYHASVVYQGYLYVIGGYTTAHNNSVLYAQITSSGTLGTWTTNTSTFTNARSAFGAVTYHDKLYILGGYGTSFVEFDDVQYATFNSDRSVSTFTATTSFATARDSHYTAVIGKYVYVVGGWNGTTNYADVQFAEINPSGGLVGGLSSCPGGGTLTNGTWCTTTSLQTARHAHTGYVAKGCVYVVAGGIAGNTLTASAEYACVNTDGTLGVWSSATAPTSIQRNYASGAVSKDIMYLIGGESSGQPAFFDTYYAPINHGGSGETVSFTYSGGSFTNPRFHHTVVATNGYLYVLGGYKGTLPAAHYDDVQFAPINEDGTLGAWSSTTSFATARQKHTSFAMGGRLYVVGGCTDNSFTATANTQVATINADGTLGSWSNAGNLPEARCEHATAINGNDVYFIAGRDSGFIYSSVYKSTINPSTGQFGSWSSVTTLNSPRSESPVAAVNNGYLYVLAGNTYNRPHLIRSVEFAKINSDGTLGTWRYTSELPGSRNAPGVAAVNGYLYVIGGNDGGGNVATTLFASFGPDGHLDEWAKSSTSFTTQRLGHEAAVYNGYVYIAGGYDGSGYLSDVRRGAFGSIQRNATYSKLIDLGAVSTVNSVTSNGAGESSLTFRIADSDGVFGTSQASGSTGGVSARYIWVRVSLDDRNVAFFADSLSRKSSTADVTIDYTSGGAATCTTDQRLRHGASFSSGTLQGLGSCTQ